MSSVSNLIALTVLIFGAVDVSQASHSLGPSPPPTTITPKTVNNTLSTSPAFVGKADIRGGELLKTQSIIKNRKAKVQTTVSKSAEIKELVSPDPLVDAEYIADTKLPTDKGNFRMRAYRVKDETFDPLSRYSNINSMEPIVIYAADKPPFGRDGKLLEHVPVRIHDQCLTSEVFRSRR